MYKVFIDQVPVFFVKFRKDFNSSESLDISSTSFDEVKALVSKGVQSVVVRFNGEDIEKEFNDFFNKIDIRVASGGVLKNKEDEFLMIKRFGNWDFPKGHQENDETLEETAYREVEEECGVSGMKLTGYLETTYHTYSYKGQTVLKKCVWFNFDYFGNEALVPQTEEDIEKVEWVTRTFMKEKIDDTYGSIKDLIERVLSSE